MLHRSHPAEAAVSDASAVQCRAIQCSAVQCNGGRCDNDNDNALAGQGEAPCFIGEYPQITPNLFSVHASLALWSKQATSPTCLAQKIVQWIPSYEFFCWIFFQADYACIFGAAFFSKIKMLFGKSLCICPKLITLSLLVINIGQI